MTSADFVQAVESHMDFVPTLDQRHAIEMFADYLLNYQSDNLMLLKGYAGTGKTTLISAFVKTLRQMKVHTVLLAPTGRAAKVLGNYTRRPAYTIHKEIYRIVSTTNGNKLKLKQNTYANTIFFVDEASMIYDAQCSIQKSVFDRRSLLDDLFAYVNEGKHCALVFIGDNAQLPPVGSMFSPALDKDYLTNHYSKLVYEYELKEVMRQLHDSGVLFHATQLRNRIEYQDFSLYSFEPASEDFVRLDMRYFMEELQLAYNEYGASGTVVVTKSNRQANMFNAAIRNRLLFMENELDCGDFVMCVKNNYFWLPKDAATPFIANGDILEILTVRHFEEFAGFRFATIRFRMLDYDMKPIEAKVLLDTLTTEEAALSYEKSMQLYAAVEEKYSHLPTKKKRREAMLDDEYLNALQIKFAYVQTCHKTQGGQWEKVFVFQWNAEQQQSIDYYRWAYTALTRAKSKIFLIE